VLIVVVVVVVVVIVVVEDTSNSVWVVRYHIAILLVRLSTSIT